MKPTITGRFAASGSMPQHNVPKTKDGQRIKDALSRETLPLNTDFSVLEARVIHHMGEKKND